MMTRDCYDSGDANGAGSARRRKTNSRHPSRKSAQTLPSPSFALPLGMPVAQARPEACDANGTSGRKPCRRIGRPTERPGTWGDRVHRSLADGPAGIAALSIFPDARLHVGRVRSLSLSCWLSAPPAAGTVLRALRCSCSAAPRAPSCPSTAIERVAWLETTWPTRHRCSGDG